LERRFDKRIRYFESALQVTSTVSTLSWCLAIITAFVLLSYADYKSPSNFKTLLLLKQKKVFGLQSM